MIAGYVWQILGSRGLFGPPIREQPQKGPLLPSFANIKWIYAN